MRLLIEIPDEMYKTVQDGTYCGSLYEELKNGIPHETVTEFADRCRECGARYGKMLKQKTDVLDEIKAEVKQLPYQRIFGKVSNYSLIDVVIEIIDKYKAESEE